MKVEDTHGSEIDMRDMKSNGRVEEEEQLPEFFTYKDIGSEYFQVLVHVSISTIYYSCLLPPPPICTAPHFETPNGYSRVVQLDSLYGLCPNTDAIIAVTGHIIL